MSRCPLRFSVLLVALAGLFLPPGALASEICPGPGQWLSGMGQPLDSSTLMAELAERRVVLLGEQHDRLAHHRWQLHTLAGLHALRPQMVIGLEMLPREAQPALDAWAAGELDETGFLEASKWDSAWGFDPGLYLPILHFARMQRIPLVALNVLPSLRKRLVEEGWETVSEEQRFAITPPAAPSEAYRAVLANVFNQHPGEGDRETGLARFINAQLVWDRAMATALANASAEETLVVGLMGQGHVTYGHGVPHQLDDLEVTDHRTLLPVTPGPDCQLPAHGYADAVFVLGDEALHEPQVPPRLGIFIGDHVDGVVIQRIAPNSLADEAGLEEGDVILRAAGHPLFSTSELNALIRRMVPGTLLPLDIARDGDVLERLARFPHATP